MAWFIIPNVKLKGLLRFVNPFGILALAPLLLCYFGSSSGMPVESVLAPETPIRAAVSREESLMDGQKIAEELVKLDYLHNNFVTTVKTREQTYAEAEKAKNKIQEATSSGCIGNIFSGILYRIFIGKQPIHERPMAALDKVPKGIQEARQKWYMRIVGVELEYLISWAKAKIANEQGNFIEASNEVKNASEALLKSAALQVKASAALRRSTSPVNPYVNDQVSQLMKKVQELQSSQTRYKVAIQDIKDPEFKHMKYMSDSNEMELEI